MSGIEEVLGLIGSAAGSAASGAGSAAASAGSALGSAAPAAAEAAAPAAAAGMGSGAEALMGGAALGTGANAGVGAVPSATAKGGGSTGLLGKMTQNVTSKDAMDLVKMAAANRQPGAPPLPAMPTRGGGGTKPSVGQFLQMLQQQRRRPMLSLGG